MIETIILEIILFGLGFGAGYCFYEWRTINCAREEYEEWRADSAKFALNDIIREGKLREFLLDNGFSFKEADALCKDKE